MTVLQTIQKDQLTARKNKNQVEASILTLVYSEAVNVGKNAGNRETTEDEVISLLKKFVKTTEQNLVIYREKNKVDSIPQAEAELEILQRYLPRVASEDEVVAAIREVMATNNWPRENATMGKVMKELKAKFGAALDGGSASKLIKAELQ